MGAIFEEIGDGAWNATPLAQGPFEGLQGGAVAGLMAGAIERVTGECLSSVTTHFLRPVPLGRLEIAVRPLRAGRRVSIVDAELSSPSLGVVAIQRATRIAPLASDLPTPPLKPADPESLAAAPQHNRPGTWIMNAMDVRIDGEGCRWFRQTIPLFPGAGAFARLVTPADFAHGIVTPLGAVERPAVALPNPDVTVHAFRQPEGAWIGVQATTAWSSNAIGAGWAALYDVHGLVGRVAMSVAIMPLPGIAAR